MEEIEEFLDFFNEDSILFVTADVGEDCLLKAVTLAKENKMKVIMDPAPVPEKGIPNEVLRRIDVLKPNETEAEIITGVNRHDLDFVKKSLFSLFGKGIDLPIITLGAQGCAY